MTIRFVKRSSRELARRESSVAERAALRKRSRSREHVPRMSPKACFGIRGFRPAGTPNAAGRAFVVRACNPDIREAGSLVSSLRLASGIATLQRTVRDCEIGKLSRRPPGPRQGSSKSVGDVQTFLPSRANRTFQNRVRTIANSWHLVKAHRPT